MFYSKSGKTIYFNGKAFQSLGGTGVIANFFDLETHEQYWISGTKKNRTDRHWAGSGKIMIEEDVVDEYLRIVGLSKLKASEYIKVKPNRPDISGRMYKLENSASSET